MRLYYIPVLFLTLLAGITILPLAQAQDYLLDEKAKQSLSKEAAEQYEQVEQYLDHVDYMGALDHYMEMLTLQPEHVGIRLAVIELAMDEARKKLTLMPRVGKDNARTTEDLLNIAEQSSQEILQLREEQREKVTRNQAEEAKTTLERVTLLRQNLDRHRKNREAVGKQVLRAYAEEIDKVGKKEESQAETESTE